jgi:hypothetical protein
MLSEFPNNLIVVEDHMHGSGSDPFSTPETEARGSWYGVPGFPDVRIDGMYDVSGASSCSQAATAYRNYINQRLTATGGVSPVAVTGYFSSYQGSGSLQATFELQDPAALGTTQAVLYLYEDHINWCCGYGGVSIWDEVARVVRTQPVTLSNVGDRVTVVEGVTIDPSWNPANLHAFALIQQTTGSKTIIQAARLTSVIDFALNFPRTLGSVPQGNGTITFSGTVQNVSNISDVLSLAVGDFGWPADFQIAGDPTWYTGTDLALAPGESKDITVRVQTDGTKRIGTGHFTATSSATGRQQPATIRVFNGSPAVLLVDDDNGSQQGGIGFEVIFENGLNNRGYLWDDWDIAGAHAGASPTAAQILGYDVIIWQTAYVSPPLLSTDDVSLLEGFLDGGGSVFMSSQQLLNQSDLPSSFLNNYLGVASFVLDTHALTAVGVGGDPITNGMSLPLTWPQSSLNRVDTVNPTATASAIFFSETGHPAAVRNILTSGGRVVFSSVTQNASRPEQLRHRAGSDRRLALQQDRSGGHRGAAAGRPHPDPGRAAQPGPGSLGPALLALAGGIGRAGQPVGHRCLRPDRAYACFRAHGLR